MKEKGKWKRMEQQIFLTYYYYPDTEPLKNIMRLPREEAFALARQLADSHPETTAFYRFADFENYYPGRMKTDALMYERFCLLGGKPRDRHPLSFVLEESDYLHEWFGRGKAIHIPLEQVDGEIVSFTLGDSMSTLTREGDFTLLTLPMLMEEVGKYPDGIKGYLQEARKKYHYIEVQVWGNVALPAGD
ncbi:MAG: hypothetical protein IJN44_05305 [Clostridia bacterium]|nr:hypothetical protein [Clostridia bacterium]